MEDIWTVEEKSEESEIAKAIDRLADAVRNQTMAMQIIARRRSNDE